MNQLENAYPLEITGIEQFDEPQPQPQHARHSH